MTARQADAGRRWAGFPATGAQWAGTALSVIGALGVIAMLVHVVLDVLMRFLFNNPITGTLEITTYYYMIAVAFIGAFSAQQRLEHIEITALTDRMGPNARLWFSVFADVITLAFLAALIWYGWDIAMGSLEEAEVAEATQVLVSPAGFILPLGLGAYAIRLLLHMVRTIARVSAPEHEFPEEVVI